MKHSKFLFLFLAFLLTNASVALAQDNAGVNKGAWLVGASSNMGLNVSIPSGGGSSTTIFNLNGKAGYFLEDNFALGANLGYASVGSSNATTIGVFGRYYIQGKIFAGAGYNHISSSSGASQGAIPLEVGYAGFIAKNLAIEPAIGYTIVTDGGGSVFGLNLGFALYFNRE